MTWLLLLSWIARFLLIIVRWTWCACYRCRLTEFSIPGGSKNCTSRHDQLLLKPWACLSCHDNAPKLPYLCCGSSNLGNMLPSNAVCRLWCWLISVSGLHSLVQNSRLCLVHRRWVWCRQCGSSSIFIYPWPRQCFFCNSSSYMQTLNTPANTLCRRQHCAWHRFITNRSHLHSNCVLCVI